MIIRKGFVSNSSSASYIITINNITKQKLFDICRSDLWYELDNLKGMIEEHLKTCVDDVDDNGVVREWCLDRIKELNDYIQRLNDTVDGDQKIEVYLDYRGISLKEEAASVILETFTSMHNSYNEGMGDLLKEMCFLFMFEYPEYRMTCKRED